MRIREVTNQKANGCPASPYSCQRASEILSASSSSCSYVVLAKRPYSLSGYWNRPWQSGSSLCLSLSKRNGLSVPLRGAKGWTRALLLQAKTFSCKTDRVSQLSRSWNKHWKWSLVRGHWHDQNQPCMTLGTGPSTRSTLEQLVHQYVNLNT